MRHSRRTFLRGAAGAFLALPALEYFGPKKHLLAASDKPPTRLITVALINGTHPTVWHPKTEGRSWEILPGTAPLEPFRDQVMMLTGLHHRAIKSDGGIQHNHGEVNVLTSRPWLRDSKRVATGPSLDQVVAKELGHGSPFSSLVVTPDTRAPVLKPSWISAGHPAPMVVGPLALHRLLFPAEGLVAYEANRARRGRLLDLLAGDAVALKKKLGARDRMVLEEHLGAIEAVEERSIRLIDRLKVCQSPEVTPRYAEETKTARFELMVDLLVMAMRCELTQVVTISLRSGPHVHEVEGDQNSPLVSDHEASHMGASIIGRTTANKMRWMAYLIEKLKDTADIDGHSMLYNSLVYLTNDISHGNQHDFDDMPILLAGQAGGAMRSGLHVRYADQPVAKLHTTLLKLMGVEATRFGLDGDGWLAGLAS